ncbi:Glyoxalase/bleomycin resistance protein/dioxygenase [Xylariaceae sp. FL0662B]|nr:Glyoxalase/bleomycin resistance protein/dioxygenase [Xylariaceae sp. FL0662B]
MSTDPIPTADSAANMPLLNPLGKVSAINLFVNSIPDAKAFYKYVFDVPVIFEDETSCTIRFDNLVVNLLQAAKTEKPIRPAAVDESNSGRGFQLSIWVTDLDPICEALAEKGIKLDTGPQIQPSGTKSIAITDPSGHCWEVVQNMKK